MSFNPILTRVLVYDPNPFLAESICAGIELCGPFTTKACCADLDEVLLAFRPNIVVVDPAHVPGGPEQGAAQVRRVLPNCDLLAYVDVGDRTAAARCLASGFSGAVSQGKGIETLVDALTVARLGGVYVDQCLSPSSLSHADLQGRQDVSSTGSLSERERFVLEHIARGFSNKEIAAQLGLSVKTVETYRSRAATKLGLRRKSDIFQFALRSDWLSAQPCAL